MERLLLDKINKFEDPIYDEQLVEEKRIIAYQCYFGTFLSSSELYEALLKWYSKDFAKENIDFSKLVIGDVLIVKSESKIRHFCITKILENEEIEFSLLSSTVLYKICLRIIPKKIKNESKFIYTESYRFSKSLDVKKYKNLSKKFRSEIVKRSIDLKQYILNQTKLIHN